MRRLERGLAMVHTTERVFQPTRMKFCLALRDSERIGSNGMVNDKECPDQIEGRM